MADNCVEPSCNMQPNGSEKPPKIARVEKESKTEAKREISTLENFSFRKVLINDVNSKTVYIQARYSSNQSESDALIKLEKAPFDDKSLNEYLTDATKLRLTFQNDIYSQYTAIADPELNTLKAVTILPATEKHIKKYTKQDYFIIKETPKDYNAIVLPFLKDNQHNVQWVHNILDHKAEVNRIIYEDLHPETGFMLLPDLKWNEQQIADLHLTAIVVKRGISSLRDLKKEHLPLLKNVLEKGKVAAKEKYGVNPDELRVFVHYYPSYYYLHIHFMSTSHVSSSCAIGKAHFLDDIIDNIENIDEEFYQKKTITVTVGSQDELLKRFIDAGRIAGAVNS